MTDQVGSFPSEMDIASGNAPGKTKLSITGTSQQLGLIYEVARSLQRGTFVRDVQTLIGRDTKSATMVTESDNENIRSLSVRLIRCSGCGMAHRALRFDRMNGFETINGLVFHYRATCPRSKETVYLRFEDTVNQSQPEKR